MEKQISLDEREKRFGELDSLSSTVTTDCDKGEKLIGPNINNGSRTAKQLLESECDIQSKNDTALAFIEASRDVCNKNEGIHLAATNGNVQMVKHFSELNANKNATGFNGATPVLLAAESNHCETSNVLIEAGCDTDSENEFASWNFEIQNEEMYLTNGNMSSMMELYIPKGALPSGSSTLVKATIRQQCNNNSETQDQEGQVGPTISLLPHGTKFARPILALIRLPYDDLINAEEFEFIVLHSDTEVDAPKEWVEITEFEKGETSGIVVPEHNVSMVVLFHFSILTWFRKRRTKTLEVLVFASLECEILTVTCLFCPIDDENGKDVNANWKGTEIDRQHLVITSQNSTIGVNIENISKAWKLLSLQNQEVSHDLVWRNNSFPKLRFVFEKGNTPTKFVCNIVAQQQDAKAAFTILLPQDYLTDRQSKSADTSNCKLGPEIKKPRLDSCTEHVIRDASHVDYDEPYAAGSESTTKISLPTDYQSCYSDEENERIHAQHNRRIPEQILKIVNQNRDELIKLITIGTEFLNHLKCKQVFTTEQISNIQIKDGLMLEQASMVLDMLPKISFYHYLMFRDCLMATNQQHVCAYLPPRDCNAIV